MVSNNNEEELDFQELLAKEVQKIIEKFNGDMQLAIEYMNQNGIYINGVRMDLAKMEKITEQTIDQNKHKIFARHPEILMGVQRFAKSFVDEGGDCTSLAFIARMLQFFCGIVDEVDLSALKGFENLNLDSESEKPDPSMN